MNNLKQIEIEMNNFKKKLSKLSLNNRAEYQAKQNENKFEMNDLKVDNLKRDSETTSSEMMENLDMRNVNLANLENLLKMNLMKKNKNENKFAQKAPQSTSNQNVDITSNSLNLSASDQNILKKLLKGENKTMKDNSSLAMNNGGDNESTAEVNKQEKIQVDEANNKVSENKKGNSPSVGMSLSEIEKQITMLKNLAIKS